MSDSRRGPFYSRFHKVIICNGENVGSLRQAYKDNPQSFETDAIYLVKKDNIVHALYFMPDPMHTKKKDNSKVYTFTSSFPKNISIFPESIKLWPVSEQNRIEIQDPDDVAEVASLCRANRMHVLPKLSRQNTHLQKSKQHKRTIVDLQKEIDKLFVQTLDAFSTEFSLGYEPPISTQDDFYARVLLDRYTQLQASYIDYLKTALSAPPSPPDESPNVLSLINAMLQERSSFLQADDLPGSTALLNIRPESFSTDKWLEQCIKDFKLLTEYGSNMTPGLIALSIQNPRTFLPQDIHDRLGASYFTQMILSSTNIREAEQPSVLMTYHREMLEAKAKEAAARAAAAEAAARAAEAEAKAKEAEAKAKAKEGQRKPGPPDPISA